MDNWRRWGGVAEETANESLPPEQESSNSVYDKNDDKGIQVEAWPITACGCYSPDKAHLKKFETFQANVNAALQKLPPQHQQYDRVRVLVVYWELSDVPNLSETALELKALFEVDYGFEADTHVLENGSDQSNDTIHLTFSVKLLATIQSINEKEKNNLLILYYAGHGAELREEGEPIERIWQPAAKSSTYLQWKDFQRDLRKISCDILFVFDCCFALAMIDDGKKWNRRCEILCASGARERASATRKCSFTRALVRELSKRKNAKGINVLWFFTVMTSTSMCDYYGLSPSPKWRRFSGSMHQSSIFLESKRRQDVEALTKTDSGVSLTDSLHELDTLTQTRVLIKLRLTDPAELLLEDEWIQWFQKRPSNIAGIELTIVNKIRCHGLFKSDSSLLLCSMPIWIWVNMQSDPAYEAIGIIRSPNLMLSQAAPRNIPLGEETGLISSVGDTGSVERERVEDVARIKRGEVDPTVMEDHRIDRQPKEKERVERGQVEREWLERLWMRTERMKHERMQKEWLELEREKEHHLEQERRELEREQEQRQLEQRELERRELERGFLERRALEQKKREQEERERAQEERRKNRIQQKAQKEQEVKEKELRTLSKRVVEREKATLRREEAVAENEQMLVQREHWLIGEERAKHRMVLGEEKAKSSRGTARSRQPNTRVSLTIPAAWIGPARLSRLTEGSFEKLINKRTQPVSNSQLGRRL